MGDDHEHDHKSGHRSLSRHLLRTFVRGGRRSIPAAGTKASLRSGLRIPQSSIRIERLDALSYCCWCLAALLSVEGKDAMVRAHRIFVCLLIVGVNLWAGAVSSAPMTSDEVRVIDGDTIRLNHQKPDIRLIGFNAPETRRAICQAERELGDKATRRLRDLVQSSKLDFEFVACACPPGTEGTPSCNYGRRCGTLKANGQDVGLILIRENLAVPFVCGQARCPPTPKPWCN